MVAVVIILTACRYSALVCIIGIKDGRRLARQVVVEES